MPVQTRPLRLAIVAGEESGDFLGARLMESLRRRNPDMEFVGVGGRKMIAQGLRSYFAAEEITLWGITALFSQLPRILVILRDLVEELNSAQPDGLVIIDSPDFTHVVARRMAQMNPDLPIVNYVSPTVWAWRPGRARKMRKYVDHVLALLPFEPAAYVRLGGPACTYVGHPLVERIAELHPADDGAGHLKAGETVVLALPGSRRGEVSRHMPVFGETLALVAQKHPNMRVIIPAVPHLVGEIEAAAAGWTIKPDIVAGEDEKLDAFRRADAALASSGTVTLELALARVPMVVAYRLDWLVRHLKWMVNVPAIVLVNLIVEDRVIPEFLDDDANPENLAQHLLPLLRKGPERTRQLDAFALAEDRLALAQGQTPSGIAADIVMDAIGKSPARSR